MLVGGGSGGNVSEISQDRNKYKRLEVNSHDHWNHGPRHGSTATTKQT